MYIYIYTYIYIYIYMYRTVASPIRGAQNRAQTPWDDWNRAGSISGAQNKAQVPYGRQQHMVVYRRAIIR